MKKKLLSLFSGCGGMDIGFEGNFSIIQNTLNKDIHKDWIAQEKGKYITLAETIFETVFANDINKYAKIAWDNYFSSKRGESLNETFKVESIVNLVKRYRAGEKDIFPSDIDIVTGGFPCQDFSIAGRRNGFNSHKDHNGKIIDHSIPTSETRGQLYIWMKEVIEITKPKIFIAENVKGLANLGKVKDIIQHDFSKIDGNGYFVFSPKVLHAGNYGIPQSRERIFFIGVKKSALKKEVLKKLEAGQIENELSPYPIPTHRINGELHYSIYESKLQKYVAVKHVIEDLLEPEEAEDISQKYFSKAKYMGAHCQGQNELKLDKLAPTIRAEHHGNIEYRRLSLGNGGKNLLEIEKGKKERRLTLRECARIQTFPDDFNFVIPSENSGRKFQLSASQGYKLVGNAVPPLLAYHIAKKIESIWELYFGE